MIPKSRSSQNETEQDLKIPQDSIEPAGLVMEVFSIGRQSLASCSGLLIVREVGATTPHILSVPDDLNLEVSGLT